MNLRNKKFLITQNDISSINGSSITVLELAEYLIEQGSSVVVYTYFLNEPLDRVFRERNIHVVVDENDLSILDFDYIWVHHQVLPLSIIKQLGVKSKSTIPKFIFNHMSSIDQIADEFPYIWDLENRLSSLSLFNSVETKNKQAAYLSRKIRFDIFPNPAPRKFYQSYSKQSGELRKILVVSNHPPDELINIDRYLQKHNIEIHFMGEFQEDYRIIEPELLASYDVIVTIGKTVQYCLVQNIPVYIYDHFGGPGFLNVNNYEKTSQNNFSGRGFEKKTSNDIALDLVEKYIDAVNYQSKNHKQFKNKYALENVFSRVMDRAGEIPKSNFNKSYINYLITSHNYSREHRIASRLRVISNNRLKKAIKELDQIEKSFSYKIGRLLTWPVRVIRGKLKK